MSGSIYVLSPDGQLTPLREEPWDSEDVLQRLLADHPSLLAGEQMDAAHPRRWLLVSREAPVPDEEEGSARWSLDHLFLDQDGIPTLVEVKRSTDTRIRREVVGQMLDYAANAAIYVPVERMRELLARRCASDARDPAAEVASFLGEAADPDAFWQRVKVNLQAKRIRMVFLADAIPTELRTIVEFLNEQMDPAEVLAVEVKRYVGGELQTLVPTVFGQSSAATQKKSAGASPKRPWDDATFFDDLARRGAIEVHAARRLLDWARSRGLAVSWGKGSTYGSFFPMVSHGGVDHYTFGVWSNGYVDIQFQWMIGRAPFGSAERREELRRRLNEIPGVAIPEDGIGRRPSAGLAALATEPAIEAFLAVWDWYLSEIRGGRGVLREGRGPEHDRA